MLRLVTRKPAQLCCSLAPRRSVSSIGLIGMPNVGKSTLFNALVGMEKAQAANYPFCTIEPNIASVVMPDPRLEALSKVSHSERCIGIQVEWHDIAGLIAGASQGAGLGNAFLGHIRAVAAVVQVVRCFSAEDVIHVLDRPDPVRDMAIIENELILADLQSVEKRLMGGKSTKGPDGAAVTKILVQTKEILEAGLPARLLATRVEPSDRLAFDRLQLLTQKPMIWVCNVADVDAASGNAMTVAVRERVEQKMREDALALGLPPPPPELLSASVCTLSATLEQEVSSLYESSEERRAVLAEYGLQRSGLERILEQCGALLHLRYYYTTGPMEARAWAIPDGATAAEAAGVIHSDLQKNFIKADICAAGDLIAAGSEAVARAAGKYRTEGKSYVMADGDVALFHVKK